MSRIVKGYWDCPYCGNKGISGLEKRCTACGHSQDEGTKFYLKEQKEYVILIHRYQETSYYVQRRLDSICAAHR